MRRVAVLVLLTVMAACTGGDDDKPATPTSSTTTVPPAPSTTSTTNPADAAREQAFVDGDRRFLTPPAQPTTRAVDGRDCKQLGDEGWEVVGCDRVTTQAGDAIWLQLKRAAAERALLYVNDGPHWRLALRASDDTGTEFDVSVGTYDLMADKAPKIVYRFKVHDADETDGVEPPVVADVVEPSGGIVVHVVADYPKGQPDVKFGTGGGVHVWDCEVDCVSTAPYRFRRIAYAAGTWRVVEERKDQGPPN